MSAESLLNDQPRLPPFSLAHYRTDLSIEARHLPVNKSTSFLSSSSHAGSSRTCLAPDHDAQQMRIEDRQFRRHATRRAVSSDAS